MKHENQSLHAANHAFSLVELSIVLVILGLLVGGILTGQNLIHAAELRSVTKDIERFQSAVYTFRDKYQALPGDMPNAVRFWGAQAGGTADGIDSTCAGLDETSPATGKPTCNGDGNGQIGIYGWTNKHETFRAWQHMANAGLIEGTYAGVRFSSGNAVTEPRWNLPGTKINNAVGFNLTWLGQRTSGAYGTGEYYYDDHYGNTIVFGKKGGWHGTGWVGGVATEDAWNLDTKMDDGKPGTGDIKTLIYNSAGDNSSSALCANNTDPSLAEYDVANTDSNACALIFKMGF